MYKDMSTQKLEKLRNMMIKAGYPSYWPELSDLFKEEHNSTCEICSRKTDIVVHHKDGNRSNCDRDNLQCICRGCNIRLSHRRYRCQDCGIPIGWKGYCVACYAKRKYPNLYQSLYGKSDDCSN